MIDSFAPVDPKLVDVALPEDGYPAHLAAEDTPDVLRDVCGSASREFPASLWIDPKDWEDKARENDKNQSWAMQRIDRYTDQSPSHSCTCHSLRANFEAARNRARGVIYPEGPKKGFRYEESGKFGSVWMSTLSVYARANPREWGGANVRQVLEIAVRDGMVPDRIQPAEYNLKHTMQGTVGRGGLNESGGGWVPESRFPENWRETAKHFRPLEVVFPSSYEEAVCLLLHGYAVSVGRSGHAVPWAMWMASNRSAAYPDSYQITRYDSERTMKTAWRGSFSIISTTVPDSSWEKPAG